MGFYGLAVFLEPLQEAHGWSNTTVSAATGTYFVVGGLSGALVGPAIDRRGPLPFIVGGLLAMGTAVSLIGFVNSRWQLFAVYGVLAVAFGVSTGVPANALITRWFVTRRARAMSVSATGISAGGLVLSPLGAKLVEIGGLELAAPAMGALLVLVGLPVATLVIVSDPRDVGLEPDGPNPRPRRLAGLDDAVQLRTWTLRQATRTAAFWAILVGFLLVLTSQTGFLIHQIAFLDDRLGSRNAAALALSTTAFGSIVARLIVGVFADAIDKRLLTAGLFIVQGSAMVGVLVVDSPALTYAMVLLFGFSIGNIYMMQALLIGEVFGLVSFGRIFGTIRLAGQIGSGFGPFAVGWLETTSGGYEFPFTLAAVLTFTAVVTVVFVQPRSTHAD